MRLGEEPGPRPTAPSGDGDGERPRGACCPGPQGPQFRPSELGSQPGSCGAIPSTTWQGPLGQEGAGGAVRARVSRTRGTYRARCGGRRPRADGVTAGPGAPRAAGLVGPAPASGRVERGGPLLSLGGRPGGCGGGAGSRRPRSGEPRPRRPPHLGSAAAPSRCTGPRLFVSTALCGAGVGGVPGLLPKSLAQRAASGGGLGRSGRTLPARPHSRPRASPGHRSAHPGEGRPLRKPRHLPQRLSPGPLGPWPHAVVHRCRVQPTSSRVLKDTHTHTHTFGHTC